MRLLVPALVAVLAGCHNGELAVLGYSSAPPYDPSVRSVFVPVFKTSAFVAGPYRGIEVRATDALVRELNSRRTPMKVVGDPARADSELVVTLVQVRKQATNRTTQNHNREFEVVVEAEVVWRDLRTGRVLSGGRGPAIPERPVPFDPSVVPPADPPPAPVALPTTVQAVGRTIFELGETNATGEDMALRQLAETIVNLMETPW